MAKKLIKDIMTPVVAIDSEASVEEASLYMSSQRAGAILIKERDEYVGIFTKADLIIKILEKHLDPASVKVSTVMSHPLISLERTLTIEDARKMMEKRNIRHLAVTDQGRVVGLLAVNNLSA